MTAPLAPVVDGPIYAVPNIPILVDNVLPDALVKVFQAGVEVGHATSTSPGSIWVPTTIALVAGSKITATQTYTGTATYVGVTAGVASPESNFAVTVLAPPKLLPIPVFESGINQCSNSVLLGNLFQGATLSISQDGTALGGGLVEYPTQWFTLTGPEPTPGQPLGASQRYRDSISPSGRSALVAPEPKSLSTPVVAQPLRDCQTFLEMSNMTPGANLTVKNGAYIDTATSPAETYTLNLPPLAVGILTAQQSFTRCQNVKHSTTAVYHVKNVDLPRPVVGYDLCPGLGQLTVTNLVPGEVLEVSAVIEPSGQPQTVNPLGSQGVSASTATVFLPALPANTVAVQISVTLCGIEVPPPPAVVTVPLSTSGTTIGPPALVGPLYDCARSVIVANAHPGCLVTVFSGTTANVLANPVVASASELVIPLWTALVTGEHVSVAQTGCHAEGQSKPLIVLAPPNPVPIPDISKPVLSDATSVTVTGVLPGAQVFLYVNGVFRSQLIALGATVVLPLGEAALTGAKYIEITQELCGQTSARNDNGPGYAPVQTPETPPVGGLIGNSNYAYANAGDPVTGVSVSVEITKDIELLYDSGGDLTSDTQTGYSFQLNCICPTADKTFWQQYIVAVFNNTLNAVINNWSPGVSSTGSLEEVVLIDTYPGTQLKQLSGYTLPAGYTFTIALDSSNEGGTNPHNNVLSVTFSGKDENGNPFGAPLTQVLTNQTDLQTHQNVLASDLSPVYVIGCYLVGPDNSEFATLKSGAGKITLSSNGMTAYPGISNIPATFDLPVWGTIENSNAVYSEVPTGSSTTFIQTFSVP
jgi:hypothetical protein